MKTNKNTISDYYPLCFDIADIKQISNPSPEVMCISTEALCTMSLSHGLSDLQLLVLLAKNVFEGYCCHWDNVPVAQLTIQGTSYTRSDEEDSCKELAADFFSRGDLYQNSLELGWKEYIKKKSSNSEFDFYVIQQAVLNCQLYRLPVVSLNENELTIKGLSCKVTNEHAERNLAILHSSQSYLAQKSLVDRINNLYFEKFKELILKLESKGSILMQLYTRLNYANEPNIQTFEQLDKMYYNFVISYRNNEHEQWLNSLKIKEETESGEIQKVLKPLIKKTYKAISKNCAEVHAMTDENEQESILRTYFIEAAGIYNSFAISTVQVIMQYTKLHNILFKLINLRHVNKQHQYHCDLSELCFGNRLELKKEEVLQLQKCLENSIQLLHKTSITAHKIKFVYDEELTLVHTAYLQSQLAYVEKCIDEITSEINMVMESKIKENFKTI